MSYIIKSTTPFASTKVTEKGREKLAKGQLNFNTWSVGDSEINYDREFYVENQILSGTTKILRPKDKQPNLKYFITNNAGIRSFTFGSGDIRCIKAVVDNKAKERGFFEGNLATGFTTNTSINNYIKGYANISLTGGIRDIDISTFTSISGGTISIGDVVLLKMGYPNSDFSTENPTPHLWFKVQNLSGNIVTVDRDLPVGGTAVALFYSGGEVYDNEPDSIAYWDTGTLSFDSSCHITVEDVPIWNMNIPYSEDILGITGTTQYEKHRNFGSYDLVGQKNNYLYNIINPDLKSIGIIHYSNKTISNLYGEFLHVDEGIKRVKIHLPTLMYHRRNFSGSTMGDKMGMTFTSDGPIITSGANGMRYVALKEEATLVSGTPRIVGRVYIDLKIIVIDDAEILAAMSYKSNRNWTLPTLLLTQTNPSGGVGTGILPAGQTMYVTYAIDNGGGSGLRETLPNQNYSKITNTSTNSIDVQFNINDIGLLPYMRNVNNNGGFYGNSLKIIYQITNGERPISNAWRVLDFSESVRSGGVGSLIDVSSLETQNPLAVTPRFQLTQANDATSTLYSLISALNMPSTTTPEILQFGDERFFYGNVETFIGATIFKTVFKISINASDFNKTTNLTRSTNPSTNPPNIKVSEVGIYDSDGDLVIISKLSVPVELTPGKTVILELSMDF